MNSKIAVLPAKWHPKRTYPKKAVPDNAVQFPEVMTLTRSIRLQAANRDAR